jgi:translation initiation factor 5B
MKIPVRNFALGPVFRSHVLRAGRMLETASEYALILAFDVSIDKDAKEYADKEGVKIFSGELAMTLPGLN